MSFRACFIQGPLLFFPALLWYLPFPNQLYIHTQVLMFMQNNFRKKGAAFQSFPRRARKTIGLGPQKIFPLIPLVSPGSHDNPLKQSHAKDMRLLLDQLGWWLGLKVASLYPSHRDKYWTNKWTLLGIQQWTLKPLLCTNTYNSTHPSILLRTVFILTQGLTQGLTIEKRSWWAF